MTRVTRALPAPRQDVLLDAVAAFLGQAGPVIKKGRYGGFPPYRP
jgi:hypothetical protein